MIRYLSRPEVAERIRVKPDTLNRYKLPEPDAQIGARQLGWLPETIDAWDEARPNKRRKPCLCGCGAHVERWYVQGHDAKHVSRLLNDGTEYTAALAELPSEELRDKYAAARANLRK